MAAPRQRPEPTPYCIPGKFLLAAPLDNNPTVVPAGFVITVLAAKKAKPQCIKAKGDTSGHSYSEYYHSPKARLRAAARG